jgi:hypothetical protein
MIILDTDHISVLQHEDSPKTVVLLRKPRILAATELARSITVKPRLPSLPLPRLLSKLPAASSV